MKPLYGHARAGFLVGWLALSTDAQKYIDVPWSTKKYGPDGPWQAIKVTFGGLDPNQRIEAQNHADVDVYPGGMDNAYIFNDDACKPFPNSHCGSGGTWNAGEQATELFDSDSINHYTWFDSSQGMHFGPHANYTQRAITIKDHTVWEASIVHTNVGNITHFNGSVEGLRIGTMPLGGKTEQTLTINQTDTSTNNVTFQVYNSKLKADGVTDSYSFGLHIGSAAFNYPGSLVFGGYNRGRVIGPVTTFSHPDRVLLHDIGIGVDSGESPFDGFRNKSGLLVGDRGELNQSLRIIIDPLTPYLALPDNTCETLATVLPIKFDEKTKYYLWDTENPKFHDIVTSPAYLGFTFPPANGESANVTIKVPFALLNLTLEDPIVDKPTQYFPCHAFDPPNLDTFRLGRAFLQAAFYGRNWGSQTSWLAQAAGPGVPGKFGLGDEMRVIEDTDTAIDAYGTDKDYFSQSWADHWSIINSDGPGYSYVSHYKKKLSPGAKAGIAVGVCAVAIPAIIAGAWLWRKRRKNKVKKPAAVNGYDSVAQTNREDDKDRPPSYHQSTPIPVTTEAAHYYNANDVPATVELAPQRSPQELGPAPEPQELPGSEHPAKARPGTAR